VGDDAARAMGSPGHDEDDGILSITAPDGLDGDSVMGDGGSVGGTLTPTALGVPQYGTHGGGDEHARGDEGGEGEGEEDEEDAAVMEEVVADAEPPPPQPTPAATTAGGIGTDGDGGEDEAGGSDDDFEDSLAG
jgi:hypothetical protein